MVERTWTSGTSPSSVHELCMALASILLRHDVPGAEGEARELMAALLEVPRFWPSLHADAPVSATLVTRARAAAEARGRGAPLAYAVGRAAFRHLTLRVDERVLIPRPETEQLVEIALEMCDEGGIALDIGTGSGCIALALATEGRFERVIATDVSADAIRVARANARLHRDRLRAPIEVRHGALLRPVADVWGRARLLISNPPYISYDEAAALPHAVRDWEPCVALFSGDGGLAATAAIIRDGADVLAPDGIIAIEVDARRASLAAEMLASDARYREVGVRLDLTGRERFVVARREGP